MEKGIDLCKEKMIIFIEGMHFDMWKTVKNGPFGHTHTHQVNDIMISKKEDDWSKKEREKVQRSMEAKTIITTAFALDEFLCVSH